jgi:azurin
MANTVTKQRRSSSLRTMLIENAATTFSGTTVMIEAEDIENYDRATIQIRNEAEGATITAKVWGTLFDSAGSMAVDSDWVQIGDDIEITNNTGSLKSLSTTGLRYLAVTMSIASGTPEFNVGNCKVFLQGTI